MSKFYYSPPDLLDDTQNTLIPYSQTQFAEPLYSTALYPLFSLSSPATAAALVSTRDHPIRLQDFFQNNVLRASYPLIDPDTERFIAPHSLIFARDGSRFVAGSEGLLTVFDLTRDGSGPISWMPTIENKRKRRIVGGQGVRGLISSMDISVDGTLAVGSFNRDVGLYSQSGSGEEIAVFELPKNVGRGVSSVKWGGDGRYLYISERKGEVMLMYDIRNTGNLVRTFTGRKAETNQRLGIDVFGDEVWAGGLDGKVQVWKYCPDGEDLQEQEPSLSFDVHVDAVTGTAFHSSGVILATASATRREAMFEDDAEAVVSREKVSSDSSLKIWSLETK
jgi:WD40 repeat protein